MSDPLALLQRLAEAAPAALGEDGERLAEALERVLDGDCDSLDQALGIAGPGLERPATGMRRRRRDSLIRRLAAAYRARSGRGRAQAVLDALRSYETTTWPRDRHLREPPASYVGTPREILFALCALDFRLPTSSRQVEEILSDRGAQ